MRLEAFLPKCRLSRPGRQRRRPDCLFAARFVSEPPRDPRLRGVSRAPPQGPRRPAPHACALALVLALALEARKGEWGRGPAWPKCRRCLGRSSRRSQSLWDSRSGFTISRTRRVISSTAFALLLLAVLLGDSRREEPGANLRTVPVG